MNTPCAFAARCPPLRIPIPINVINVPQYDFDLAPLVNARRAREDDGIIEETRVRLGYKTCTVISFMYAFTGLTVVTCNGVALEVGA